MNTSNEDKSASRYLGLMVRAMRKQRQLTQENLSEKTDIGVQYLSRIENGSANPTLKVVSAIATAFEVALPDLFSGLEKNND